MTYIFLCILFSTVILIVFKLANKFSIPVLPIILLNYLVAFLLGGILAIPVRLDLDQILKILPFAMLIGALFIGLFFIVSQTTALSGMTITSIASKMSVIIPAGFSLIYYGESTGWIKLAGMITALIALFLSVYKRSDRKIGWYFWVFPTILFLGNGILDSLLKYTQEEQLDHFNLYLFNSLVFGSALLIAFVLWMAQKSKWPKRSWSNKAVLLGSLLGVSNFGSLFAMVNALKSPIDSSLVFFFNNTGVVLASTLLGILVFREKLSRLNLAGILLALLALFLMSLPS